MKRLLLFIGLAGLSVLITSYGIVNDYSGLTIFLTNCSIGAMLGGIKGWFFYD